MAEKKYYVGYWEKGGSDLNDLKCKWFETEKQQETFVHMLLEDNAINGEYYTILESNGFLEN